MSGIADFRLIKVTDLGALKEASIVKVEKGFFRKKVIDNYWDFLESHTSELEGYDGSGYVFASLLVFLQEVRKIDLLSSEYSELSEWLSRERETTVLLFTYSHKQSYLAKLNSESIEESDLMNFNTEFSGMEDPSFPKAALEGIRVIGNGLSKLDNEHAVLLTIA